MGGFITVINERLHQIRIPRRKILRVAAFLCIGVGVYLVGNQVVFAAEVVKILKNNVDKPPRIRKRDILRKFVSDVSGSLTTERLIQSSASVGLVLIGYSAGRFMANARCVNQIYDLSVEFDSYRAVVEMVTKSDAKKIKRCYDLLDMAQKVL